VRAATVSDREALLALWREIDALHAGLLPGFFALSEPRSARMLQRTLADPHERISVAEDGAGRVRGLSHVILYDAKNGGARRAHIDSLVVAKAAQRRGCGRALVDASGQWARQRGAVELILTVWSGNVAAEAFYAALGFQQVSQVLGTKL
jgi:ribosomal protein S18 acetylase RimI-like enzyme